MPNSRHAWLMFPRCCARAISCKRNPCTLLSSVMGEPPYLRAVSCGADPAHDLPDRQHECKAGAAGRLQASVGLKSGKFLAWGWAEYGHVVLWFAATRAVLWIIGFVSRESLGRFLPVQEPGVPFTDKRWLAVWGHWDTRWYLDIAVRGYSAERLPGTGEANYAFFPLYPMAIRLLTHITGDPFLSGFLISNLALLLGAAWFYRLVCDEHGADVARRAVGYLFLLPTAFVFSGVLTESTFLLLSVGTFYGAVRGRWWLAGLLGGLAALTRPTGILLCAPLAWIAIANGAQRRGLWGRTLPLWLLPTAAAAFAAYNWHLTGDPLAFVQVQEAWGKVLSNPVEVILRGLQSPAIPLRAGAIFAVATLALSLALSPVLGVPYLLMCVLTVLGPLTTGGVALYSVSRYALGAWPLAIGLARVLGPKTDPLAAATLALLQGFLMVFWSNGSRMVM